MFRGRGIGIGGLSALLACAAALAAPAAAEAITYCVSKPSCVTAGGTDSGSDLAGALTNANNNPGDDRVEIGAGTFSANGQIGFSHTGFPGNGVEIAGAGTGQTILTGTPVAPPQTHYTLYVSGGDVSISDLTVVVRGAAPDPSISTATGLFAIGDIARVNVVADPAFESGTGAYVSGTLDDSAISVPKTISGAPALRTIDSHSLVVTDSVLSGYYGIYVSAQAVPVTTTTLRRVSSEGGRAGAFVLGGALHIDSSLMRAGDDPGMSGVEAWTMNQPDVDSLATVTNSTVLGGNGVYAFANQNHTGRTASITVDSSLIESWVYDLKRVGSPNSTANLSVSHSNYDGAVNETSGGSITLGPGNTAFADPGFVDGGAGNFDLRPDSPVRDKGNPAALAGDQSTTDFAGRPRIAAGRRDMGAYEFQPPPKPPSPKPRCAGRTATRVGTAGPDTITGTKGRDVIVARGGRDVIRGLGGADVICAGAGPDRVIGGPGRDLLLGQRGRDLLLGGPGRDRLLGGAGPDRLRGGPGRDALRGGPGRDRERQ